MDDEAALRARRVAVAASAWLETPADHEVYRRLVVAVGEWDAYSSPQLGDQDELLDELAEQSPPVAIGDVVGDLPAELRRVARRAL